jgi:hypothetical protein
MLQANAGSCALHLKQCENQLLQWCQVRTASACQQMLQQQQQQQQQ